MRSIAFILWLLASGAAAEVVLFDWSEDACARWDIPDTPARFWREDTGVAMIAGSESSRVSRGASPFALERSCAVAYAGSHDADPQDHDDRAWIHSVWAHGDGRIEALAHVEYHGHRHGTCAADDYMACWRNSIIGLESRDGRRFVRLAGPPVAALAQTYDLAQTRRSGYFNSSNIFEADGYLHVFVFAEEHGDQARGACLLRRKVGGGVWLAWNGAGFAARLSGEGGSDPGETCTPVLGVTSTLSSVLRDEAGTHVAVTARSVAGRPGLWLQRSADLLAWSAPELLVELPLLWRRDCAAPAAYAYPSLISPESPTRNFETIEGAVWLTAVRMPLGPDCTVGPERDLVAWRLQRTAGGGFALADGAP